MSDPLIANGLDMVHFFMFFSYRNNSKYFLD